LSHADGGTARRSRSPILRPFLALCSSCTSGQRGEAESGAHRPGHPEQVFRYLGRYTHRVAISNARLVSADGDQIVFRTRGSAGRIAAP
jgi:hypothetical protein